jgi:nitrate/TMAO reductase-like tetraheme cytochrome c subunit
MDWTYMGRLALSILVFAPGMVVLAGLALAGTLAALEKAVERFSAPRITLIATFRGRRPWVYVLLLAVSGGATVCGGMDVYRRTETPEFCGSCHEMEPRFRAWKSSPHSDVTCADCHSGRAVGGWMRVNTDGLRELRVHFTADSFDHIRLTERQEPVVNANCRRCHAVTELVAERNGLVISHERHLEKGADCLGCHSAGSSHPPQPTIDAVTRAGSVDAARCYDCHDGTRDPGGEIVFDARDEESCERCHPQASLALGHGDEGTCLECHDAHEDEHFPLGEDSQICAKCHREHVDAAAKSPHDPERPKACRECHQVMSPATLYGTGPRPATTQCYGCHEDFLALVEGGKPTSSSGFVDGDTDLHKLHFGEERGADSEWCFDCHRVHARSEIRGDVDLRLRADQAEPGTFEALSESGGRCVGGCHAREAVEYGGPAANTGTP